LGVKIVKADQL